MKTEILHSVSSFSCLLTSAFWKSLPHSPQVPLRSNTCLNCAFLFRNGIVFGWNGRRLGTTGTLLAIAVQCPYEGGDAVYQARALLGDGAVYDDSTACDTSSQQFLKRPTNPSETIEFSITPNPGNGYTFVELQKEAEEEGDLMLINAMGKLIHKQHFLPGDKTFVLLLDEIPSGSYYVTVKTKTNSSTKIFFSLK